LKLTFNFPLYDRNRSGFKTL